MKIISFLIPFFNGNEFFSQNINIPPINNSSSKDTSVYFNKAYPIQEFSNNNLNQFKEYSIANFSKEDYYYEKLYSTGDGYIIIDKKTNKVGLVKNDTIVLEILYDRIQVTKNSDFLKIALNNKEGIYNLKKSEWNFPIRFQEVSDFFDNMFIVMDSFNRYGVVDYELKEQLYFDWKEIQKPYGDALICKSFNDEYYLFNIKEKKIVNTSAYKFLVFNQVIVAFVAQDFKGNIRIVDFKNEDKFNYIFKSFTTLSGIYGFYIFSNEDGYGVINSKGEIILPPEYDSIYKDKKNHTTIATKGALNYIIKIVNHKLTISKI